MTAPIAEKRLSLWDHEARLAGALEELAAAEAENREPSKDVEIALRDYTLTAAEKRDRVAGFLADCDAKAESYAAEIARLTRRKAALEHAADWLRQYVVGIMDAFGTKRLEGTTCSLVLAKNPERVMVEGDVPPEFQRVIPEQREPDKVKIKEALKAGTPVVNCRLVEGASRLVIR